jgi:hypothetical protein
MFGSYNNRLPQGKWTPTKGTGINSYNVGNTSKDVRPYWNKDYFNDTPAPFGKARPLKHYRKGRVIPQYIEVINPTNKSETITINFNEMRNVKSSVLNNMVSQMLFLPGSYSITPNTLTETDNLTKSIVDCKNCQATSVVSNWVPITNLNEKPEINVTNPILCCNQEYKAKQRVLPASTINKPNYYYSHFEYLQNRCQTFKQRQFNFVHGVELTPDIVKSILSSIVSNPTTIENLIATSKPGSPLSYFNVYVAQCYPNGKIYEATINELIATLNVAMFDKSLIDETQFNLLKSQQSTINNLQDYIQFINETFSETQAKILGDFIFYTIDSNKTLSDIVEGPTNLNSGCQRVYYKPNNYQFGVQGAVSSSTQILNKNVQTINKNYYLNRKFSSIEDAEILLNPGKQIFTPFIYKSKYGTTCLNNTNCGII